MGRQQTLGWSLVALVVLQMTLPALALPPLFSHLAEQGRKFAVKPNAHKKVIAESNEIAPTEQQSNGGGFNWGNFFSMILQMFLGNSGIDKADSAPSNAVQGGFNWMNLINLGLRLILSSLNNGASGLDKADQAQNTPMQLIQLISSLLEALKVSFSQRSTQARSLGTQDPVSDGAVAAITIMKGYINAHKTQDEVCMQRVICEANSECSRDAPDSGYLFCQLGTYAAGYMLERSTFTPLDAFTHAGRLGRTGESCAETYHQCNEL